MITLRTKDLFLLVDPLLIHLWTPGEESALLKKRFAFLMGVYEQAHFNSRPVKEEAIRYFCE